MVIVECVDHGHKLLPRPWGFKFTMDDLSINILRTFLAQCLASHHFCFSIGENNESSYFDWLVLEFQVLLEYFNASHNQTHFYLILRKKSSFDTPLDITCATLPGLRFLLPSTSLKLPGAGCSVPFVSLGHFGPSQRGGVKVYTRTLFERQTVSSRRAGVMKVIVLD